MFRHRRHEDDDDRDWRERRGRYEGLDPDTPERPQVKPVPRPATERQTHTPDRDGRYRDGGSDEPD